MTDETGELHRQQRRNEPHRMLIASISLLGPAFARIGRFQVFEPITGPPFIIVGTATLVSLMARYDFRVLQRLHPATLPGVATLFVCISAGAVVGATSFGRALVYAQVFGA